MRWIVDTQSTKELEQMIEQAGTPLVDLMVAAGKHGALVAARECAGGPFLVFCGSGNNGGDGWVCADDLASRGYEVSIVSPLTPEEITSDIARAQALKAVEVGLPIYVNPTPEKLEELLMDTQAIIDALCGTGFSGEMKEPFATWIHAINECAHAKVISLDVPSGLNAETGDAAEACVNADMTVTMLTLKPGLVSRAGTVVCGDIVLADLTDIEPYLHNFTCVYEAEVEDLADQLPALEIDANKYTRGHVLVVAGSALYSGAAYLAARAAEAAGAGYVTLVVPDAAAQILRVQLPTVPIIALESDKSGAFSPQAAHYIGELAEHAHAVLAGPGIMVTEGTQAVIKALLKSSAPLVLDADGINSLRALVGAPLTHAPHAARREAPLVLTPHAQELARLVGRQANPERGTITQQFTPYFERVKAAEELVCALGSSNAVVLAKGDTTVSASLDVMLKPPAGPAALAKAGTGDVLAGIVASLMAQTQNPEISGGELAKLAALASCAHADAAYKAVEEVGMRGMIATDVIKHIGLTLDGYMFPWLNDDEGIYLPDPA